MLPFNLQQMEHALVAEVLSAEYGIAVRHGCFCAHPLMWRLLQVSEACADETRAKLRAGAATRLPGAVRASVGIGTTTDDVDYFIDAVSEVASTGPRWRYLRRHGTHDEYVPDPDPRSMPAVRFDL